MNRYVFAALIALLASAPAFSKLPQLEDPSADHEKGGSGTGADRVLERWPGPARAVARAMIARYGLPTRFDDASLVWLHHGPWEKTVAYRDGWPQSKVPEEQDYLRQVIGYRVPPGKLESLMRFDARVEPNPATNELAALSSSESLNFLLLNLADDIVTEKRTVANARDFFVRTLKLSSAGKTSPYMTGFQFDPPNEKTVTPD